MVKKFPAFYGTRKFITVFTSARYLSLSWANSIQSPPSPTSWISILILSPIYVWVSPMASFPRVSPLETCAHLSPSPCAPRTPPTSFFSILPPAQYWVGSKHKQLQKTGQCKLKEEALDGTLWRNGFGRGCGRVLRQTAGWMYSINWLVYTAETACICCAIRIECLYVYSSGASWLLKRPNNVSHSFASRGNVTQNPHANLPPIPRFYYSGENSGFLNISKWHSYPGVHHKRISGVEIHRHSFLNSALDGGCFTPRAK